MSIFSENLRLLRKRRAVSQQKVAHALFVSRAALSKYEEGRREPPLEIVNRLAKYYEVRIDELINNSLENKCTNENDANG